MMHLRDRARKRTFYNETGEKFSLSSLRKAQGLEGQQQQREEESTYFPEVPYFLLI